MLKLICHQGDRDSSSIIKALREAQEYIDFEIEYTDVRHARHSLVDTAEPDRTWYGEDECIAYIRGVVNGRSK